MSFGQRDYDRTKPEIDFPGDTPPEELVVEDLIEGSGPAVETPEPPAQEEPEPSATKTGEPSPSPTRE